MSQINKDSKTEKQIASYFNKVIINAANNYYRKEGKQKEIFETTDDVEKFATTEKNENSGEINASKVIIIGLPIYFSDERLVSAVQSLNEREQLFLLYYYILGYKVTDIAKLIDMKKFGVYSLKRRMLVKIKKFLI